MQKIPKITKDLKAKIQEAQNVKQKKKTIHDPDFEENLVVLKWTMQTEKKHVNGCLYGAGFSISPCGGITQIPLITGITLTSGTRTILGKLRIREQ